jgi:hypothetical protein
MRVARLGVLLSLVLLLPSGCFLEALNLVSHVTMVHPETKDRQTCEGFSAEAVEGCVRRWESRGYQPLTPRGPTFSNRF